MFSIYEMYVKFQQKQKCITKLDCDNCKQNLIIKKKKYVHDLDHFN